MENVQASDGRGKPTPYTLQEGVTLESKGRVGDTTNPTNREWWFLEFFTWSERVRKDFGRITLHLSLEENRPRIPKDINDVNSVYYKIEFFGRAVRTFITEIENALPIPEGDPGDPPPPPTDN